MLLGMLSGMPGFRPFSIASPTRLAAPLTASDISSIVDLMLEPDPGIRTHTVGEAVVGQGETVRSAGGSRSDRSSFLSAGKIAALYLRVRELEISLLGG